MSQENYAIIDADGLIINIVLWDGVAKWSPPEKTKAIKCRGNVCGIGGVYKDGVFMPPPAAVVPKETLIARAEQIKYDLISESNQKISVIQDAVYLGMATDDEKNSLSPWKKYRVLLNRVDCSRYPDITWPEQPLP